MLNRYPSKIMSFFDFGSEKYLLENISDYVGRQVLVDNDCYTVVKAIKNQKVINYNSNNVPYKNDAELFLVCNYNNSNDNSGPLIIKTFASRIAEPNKTRMHWVHDVDNRKKSIIECNFLYEVGKQAERKRKRLAKIKAFHINENERRREEFLKNYKPQWAEAYIVAEQQVSESDMMRDYFYTRTAKTILLGFSKTVRNSASELAKFANLLDETKSLATNYIVKKRGDYFIMSPDLESFSQGWIVRKTVYSTNFNFEHYLYNILPTLK